MKDSTTPLLSELIESFFEDQHGLISSNTVQRYRTTTTDLLYHLGDQPLAAVTLGDLARWRKRLFDRNLARPTIESYIRVIRRLFNWMQEQRIITEDENIAKRLKKPNLERGEPKAATVEDIQTVLEALSFNQRWGLEPMASVARDRAIILFLVDTGCRVGGLCSITNDRLDLADYRAIVHEKGKGGRKPRLAFFSEATQAALKDWLHYHPTWLEKGPGHFDRAPFVVEQLNPLIVSITCWSIYSSNLKKLKIF